LHYTIKYRKMEIQSIRKRKSEPLNKEERKALKNYRKQFETEVACAIAIGVDRTVLNAVMLRGSGSPDTISKIREALSRELVGQG
jgi:hypothetical protein